MNSLILRATAPLVLTLMLLFSVFLLLRGHNQPGGGFVGGLMAGAAFVLYAIAEGPQTARRALRINPVTLIAGGLLVAAASGAVSFLTREPFLTGQWLTLSIPGLPPLALGTPLLFDVGVFLVVLGVTLMTILTLAEE